MNDAVITLNGLEKRFPGMDKPAVAPLDCTIHRRLCDGAGWAGRCGQNHADADAGGITETRQRQCHGDWL
ncbi:Putative ATP-binding component of a transport system [Escherichia coli]|uniref:ATP-binding component of a transport system n=1 Tax=Escherichia coli TaxID=562 RepID=A0A484WS78_ECOLX|nr:Putative ATP-binding component of a transport system [Escherichia coli]